MKILAVQLDGKIPNLALMRIAAHHRERGDEVDLQHMRRTDHIFRGLFDDWDRVYASAIFSKSQPLIHRIFNEWPDAIVGGTGWSFRSLADVGITTSGKDYSLWPSFTASMGFTQRGCRLSCDFCVVPKKEGSVVPDQTIAEIWRGPGHPKHLLLLDNDFFGSPVWRERVREIRDGEFKVCFTQGINARMLSDEAAQALGSMRCTNSDFTARRIYTAWDSKGDEKPLFRGLNALVKHGFSPDQIMVYMLIGFGNDTEEDRLYRHRKLREFGCRPYPMPYVRTPELVGFQRWIVRREDLKIDWETFKKHQYRPERIG